MKKIFMEILFFAGWAEQAYAQDSPAAFCEPGQCGLQPVVIFVFAAWAGYNLWQYFKSKKGKYRFFIRMVLLAAGVIVVPALFYYFSSRPDAVPAGDSVTPYASLNMSGERAALPGLIFLGAGRCMPCKMMDPVREQLRLDYRDRLLFEYHDVWKDPAAGHKYGIKTIPTTIFVDKDGRELHRRAGYMSVDDILRAWRDLEIDFDSVPITPGDDSHEIE